MLGTRLKLQVGVLLFDENCGFGRSDGFSTKGFCTFHYLFGSRIPLAQSHASAFNRVSFNKIVNFCHFSTQKKTFQPLVTHPCATQLHVLVQKTTLEFAFTLEASGWSNISTVLSSRQVVSEFPICLGASGWQVKGSLAEGPESAGSSKFHSGGHQTGPVQLPPASKTFYTCWLQPNRDTSEHVHHQALAPVTHKMK